MTPVIVLVIILVVPILASLILRVSSLCVFASIAGSSLLMRYVGDDVVLALTTVFKGISTNFVELGMLFLPVVLTLIFARKSLPKPKIALHLVPLIANGALLAAIALPLLPSGVQSGIVQESVGNMVRHSEDVIIGVATLLNLGLMWFLNRSKHSEPKHH